MVLTTIAVQGYRCLRDVIVPLNSLTVVTGANGSGKSSLFRALHLLTEVAHSRALAALAKEGGLAATLWAGEVPVPGTARKGPVRLQLGLAGTEFGYAIDLGLPVDGGGPFARDPQIKAEHVWAGPVARPASLLVQRKGQLVRSREASGWSELSRSLPAYDSMVTSTSDAQRAPELLTLREELRGWRFYDHLRTDAEAPARADAVGTRTPVLAGDGADLAAALVTIEEMGGQEALHDAVSTAFEGTIVQIEQRDGLFSLRLRQPGMLRALRAAELSDGTLRYLMLCAALLTPRPPGLMVLNEPETSLHPDLIAPLAALIGDAARRMQVIVVTHSQPLISALASKTEPDEVAWVELVKELGATEVAGQGLLERPSWHWPGR